MTTIRSLVHPRLVTTTISNPRSPKCRMLIRMTIPMIKIPTTVHAADPVADVGGGVDAEGQVANQLKVVTTATTVAGADPIAAIPIATASEVIETTEAAADVMPPTMRAMLGPHAVRSCRPGWKRSTYSSKTTSKTTRKTRTAAVVPVVAIAADDAKRPTWPIHPTRLR